MEGDCFAYSDQELTGAPFASISGQLSQLHVSPTSTKDTEMEPSKKNIPVREKLKNTINSLWTLNHTLPNKVKNK